MQWISIVFMVMVCGITAIPADELPSRHPNPYVDLYLQRVLEAEASHKKAVSMEKLALVKLQIAEKLLEKRAMSREEYLEKQASYEVAVAAVIEVLAQISEAKSLYQLALVRTEAGQDMPICLK